MDEANQPNWDEFEVIDRVLGEDEASEARYVLALLMRTLVDDHVMRDADESLGALAAVVDLLMRGQETQSQQRDACARQAGDDERAAIFRRIHHNKELAYRRLLEIIHRCTKAAEQNGERSPKQFPPMRIAS